jgi:hypothetical protein
MLIAAVLTSGEMCISRDLSELFVSRVKTTVLTYMCQQASHIFGKQIKSYLEIYVRL